VTDIIEHLAAIERIKARDDAPSWEYIRALCGKAADEIILLRVAADRMAEYAAAK
jgi:hypothetical protein